MNRPLGLAARCAVGVVLSGVLVLGWAWHRDRTRKWVEPQWTEAHFVPLRPGQRTEGEATWIVAVNLRCPRCLTKLHRLHARWIPQSRRERLGALVVDTSSPPRPEELRALPPVPIWWDREGIWRRRWGHRLYGEVMQFDPAGRYAGTVNADVPVETHAPGTIEEGGSIP